MNITPPPSTIVCNSCHTALVAVSGDKATVINCSSRPRNKCWVTGGFTLIELSIVLVIIGLLVGGILVGKDLIKSSEIRAQIKQFEEFKTAANTFREKYGYLPGDIPPSQTAQLGFFTFTGTYAGKQYIANIGPPYGAYRYGFGDASGDIQMGEIYVFWQHLTEAKLIPGQYGGTVGGANYLQSDTTTYTHGGQPVNACTNGNGCYDLMMPISKFRATDNHVYPSANRPYTLVPHFAITASWFNLFYTYATPFQEYMIDSKIDDGLPGTGTVRDVSLDLFYGGTGWPPCATATSPPAYDLTPTTADKPNICSIYILW